MKNTRRKLEISMAPAMPCKRKNTECFWKPRQQLVASSHKLNPRTKFGNIVESHESTRPRAEISQPKHHQYHIAGRGYSSLNHYNVLHKFISVPKAIKIPEAKAAVDREWKKLETTQAWKLEKVRSTTEVILEAQRKSTLLL